MSIREDTESLEEQSLSKFATLSINSQGRKIYEEPCTIRTCFQRDRDRIIHSKAFRRLKHKTQVFISPEGDYFRTRLTHTLEVAQIGRTIARSLRLNEDLVEAIALSHDLGHTPFGHMGEEVLNKLSPDGFKHYNQSVRVVEIIEQRRSGRGLNLTFEVLDGIQNHSGENEAKTLEGKVVKFADRIAYINHDLDDALRAGILKTEDIPKDSVEVLGDSNSQRINSMILDIVHNSKDKNYISMSDEVLQASETLRQFLFDKVYFNPAIRNQDVKAEFILTSLYNYYMQNFSKLPKEHLDIYTEEERENRSAVVIDYIASTSDNFIIDLFKDTFMPSPFKLER